MYKVPSDVSCDHALVGNILPTEYAHCIPSWMHVNVRFLKFLTICEDFAGQNVYLEIFRQLYAVYPFNRCKFF